MPQVPQAPTSTFPGQVGPNARPWNNQETFRDMLGEVISWNPDLPISQAKRFLNNAQRNIVDHRLWYGLMIRGELPIPAVYNTGSVAVTLGSPIVTGTGTAFPTDGSWVGRQFRIGITDPIGTIKSVESATSFTLDLPWNGNPYTSVGYRVYQSVFSLGPNIKMLIAMVNLRQRWKLKVNLPADWLEAKDPNRMRVMQPWAIVNAPASPAGAPQFEMYPACLVQQTFPYRAYVQPPDMVLDGDYPYTFIRSDILVKYAIAEALSFRANSPYYNPAKAAQKLKEFEMDKITLERNDDNQFPKNTIWDFDSWPETNGDFGIAQDRED